MNYLAFLTAFFNTYRRLAYFPLSHTAPLWRGRRRLDVTGL